MNRTDPAPIGAVAFLGERSLIPCQPWDALNVARDNKALTLVKDGMLVSVNGFALELCERPLQILRGLPVAELLDFIPSDADRWETDLSTPAGERISVEVTRRILSSRIPRVQVSAIRDLRARRAAADRVERQSRLIARQEKDLRAQNSKLDPALSNMFQGLAMFDAEQRVIIANDRFAEMYGRPPADVGPGTPLRQIIEHRIATGFYVGTTVEEVLGRMRARVARQRANHMTARMGDGRTIAVSITPRPDGVGYHTS
jgi:PAS domain-containing protein